MRFTIVGEVGAIAESGPLTLSGRLRHLLGALLARRNGEVSRNDLIDIVWGEQSEPANAEATLRQYVSRLRRALDDAEDGAAELVVTTPSGYRLEAVPGSVDADELTEFAAQGVRPRDFESRFAGHPYGAYRDEAWCLAEVTALGELMDQVRDLPVVPVIDGLAAQPGGIPHPASRLIGREGLVDTARELLSESRLVTFTGTGGTGKTRLAVAVAEDLVAAGRYPDGVWFADLMPLSSPAEVVGLVAKLVGVEIRPGTGPADLAAFMAPRRSLLVLDNCEHVIETCAHLAGAMLSVDGPATILATSRERLDLDGEGVVAVPPLSTAAEDEASSPAVALFIERAIAANPDVDLGHQQQLTDLVSALDGLPLAIELAAARTVVLSVPELMAGLEDRLALLSPRRRRSRTMQATIDWSYDLLDDVERRVFRALGLFVGTFDLDAVASIAGLPVGDALDVVEALVLKSMVHRATGRTATARFQLLDTLKAYARQRLESERELDDGRDRFVDYFSDAVGRHPSFYFYSMNYTAERGDDWPNITAAVEWAAARERWFDAGWLLKAAVALGVTVSTSAELLPAVEECADHLDDGSQLAQEVLHLKTNCYMDAGDYPAAREHSILMAQADDRFTSNMATVFLGYILLHQEPAEALRLIDDNLAARPDEPLDDFEINATTLRVSALAQLGRLDECEAEIARYIGIEDTNGIRQNSGIVVVVTRGVLAWLRNDPGEIYRPDLIDRYAYPDGSQPVMASGGADLLRALGAVATRADDREQVLADYARVALGGRSLLEFNSVAIVLAALAYQEDHPDRAIELLRSAGVTVPSVARLVANELAARIGIELERPDEVTRTEAPAREAVRAEARRRGWEQLA